LKDFFRKLGTIIHGFRVTGEVMPRRILSVVIAMAAVTFLAGCSSPAEVPNARAQLQTDEFSKTVDIVGPAMFENPFIGMKKDYSLLSRVDKKTRAITIQLIQVNLEYNGTFYYFQFADDDTTQSLRLVPVKRERNLLFGGDRREAFTIVVPDSTLRAHLATGYRVKLSTKDGTETIIGITPAMIAAQFAAVDAYRASGTVNAAQPGLQAAPVTTTPQIGTAPPVGTTVVKRSLGIRYIRFPLMGVMLTHVDPGSPAETAGMQSGDSLLVIDGHSITGTSDVQPVLDQIAPGSLIKIDIHRGGDPITMTVQM
jgi:membrane-associated protease RseP (regulator of RpoE activity)